MNNMSFRFYPTLGSKKGLRETINVVPNDEYIFLKKNQSGMSNLLVSNGKIKDVYWDQRRDSLIVRRDLKICNPSYLYGKNGIACTGAKLGIAILWKDTKTDLAGSIVPKDGTEKSDVTGWSMFFEHEFEPGELMGNVEFRLVVYLKSAADNVLADEGMLNNRTGIILGDLELYKLEISDDTMPFPFVIEASDSKALWWIDFSTWDDPGEDAIFGPSSFVVTLNSRIKGCPNVTGNSIQNAEMLFEITASVYAALFKKLTKEQFDDMVHDKGNPGTISSELYRVYSKCDPKPEFHYDQEQFQKCMQIVIRELSEITAENVEA